MARADLILNLVRAAARGDQSQVHRTVEAIAAEERSKHHTVLADRLIAQLRDTNGTRSVTSGAGPRASPAPLLTEVLPKRTLHDLILDSWTETSIRELIEEQFRSDLLRSFGLEPRNRILLTGPPGNGKTSLAEAIACELHLPLLVVRYESVIGSFLGETAQRISQVFELTRGQHCVLFFDEFDAVGKERGDTHETGEIKRVVSSLLLQIDAVPSYVVVVTASNHPELLDRAVWRRFQLKLELPRPTTSQIKEWIHGFEKRLGQAVAGSDALTRRLLGLSFGEIEEFGLDILRRNVLEGTEIPVEHLIKNRIRSLPRRASQKKPPRTK